MEADSDSIMVGNPPARMRASYIGVPIVASGNLYGLPGHSVIHEQCKDVHPQAWRGLPRCPSVEVVLLVGGHDEEAAPAPSAPAGQLDAGAKRLDFEQGQLLLVEDPAEARAVA